MKRHGFTLIELLCSVGIILVVSPVVVTLIVQVLRNQQKIEDRSQTQLQVLYLGQLLMRDIRAGSHAEVENHRLHLLPDGAIWEFSAGNLSRTLHQQRKSWSLDSVDIAFSIHDRSVLIDFVRQSQPRDSSWRVQYRAGFRVSNEAMKEEYHGL